VPTRADRRIVIGRVSGLSGLRGWVKLFSYTDPRANLLNFREVELGHEKEWRRARLIEGRPQGKTLIGRFEGVEDRDQAAGLIDQEIAIRRGQLPEEEGGVYWADLIGLEVINVRDESLGIVDHLIETGANDVMVVSGERERLIPFVRGPVVKEIDQDRGCILVDWEKDY
jgi:16S rRNA processing protein RimM